MPKRIIVTGTGPDVGKTVVSAIITDALDGDYWKPVQCGCNDSKTVQSLISSKVSTVHPVNYPLKNPFSPHYAAKLEGKIINGHELNPPKTKRPLIIETSGGIYAPLNDTTLLLDVFQSWEAQWILVISLYVGCINHSLLTIEALQRRNIPLLGLIFNGHTQPHMENAIMGFSKAPCLGRLFPEKKLTLEIIRHYGNLWKPYLNL